MVPPVRVLLVDDENDFLEAVSYWLVSQGYEVAAARNGIEALERISHSLPDIVFLDVVMPKMGGLETLRRLRAEYPTLPVVLIITDTHAPSALADFHALGISAVFQKQGSLSAFKQILQRTLAGSGGSLAA